MGLKLWRKGQGRFPEARAREARRRWEPGVWQAVTVQDDAAARAFLEQATDERLFAADPKADLR